MHKSIVLTVLVGATTFLSCHKSDHPASNNSCKLTGLQVKGNGWSENYIIAYGSDGRLSNVQYSDGSTSYTRSFTYASGMIIINITGTSPAIDTVFLNANGDADHIIMHMGSSNVTVYRFTYDSNRQLTKTSSQTNGGGVIEATYQYNNGDITEVDQAGGSYIYSYYTDKPSAPGDPEVLGQWIQFGVVYQKVRHLVKSISGGSVTESITYTFDASGKIISATQGSGSNDMATSTYTYDCN
ncbi:hypothetical protein Q4E93_25225 [Flavitalea sp. BT771]|uniref:hypothetical protein n=1 Tax=Flavitalea sp. BT771 TaxID=3063329 RepID=UPI0026E2721A|nr:hypothetical protein [Flavitalea sp. BT771]MDO6433934.1 hypothetical protein [Flavitalea sp. BT771]MDV6222835.1 hypothetical protein [Flavitalea sp. BT771]